MAGLESEGLFGRESQVNSICSSLLLGNVLSFMQSGVSTWLSTCSDCHIPLVATQQEAAAVAVDRLWTGDGRKEFERILDALFDAGIPFRSGESVKSQPRPWISIILYQFMRPRPTYEYGIDVFHSDRDRADAAIPKLRNDDDFDDEDA